MSFYQSRLADVSGGHMPGIRSIGLTRGSSE